ncbi:serine/threonine-protein kinase pim-1-like [Genypterus blacodes]|uniref:serine/threonine-protein kinase pim-1-like n=1 Tax=Genypterus blacodes TaxID=154954 RepID=UPI003F76F778
MSCNPHVFFTTIKMCVLSAADFDAKYCELGPLGKGGFGTVYAGFRWPEYTPVAIKHMVKAKVLWSEVERNGRVFMIPKEAALMLQASGPAQATGSSIAVSLMDWFELDQEVILVMERPTPVMDLQAYLRWNDYYLPEKVAKIIVKQLIDGAIDMNSKGVFHRDIKLENILIVQLSSGLRVRVIDFGCGSTVAKSYYTYAGTRAFAPPEWFLRGRYKAGPTTVWQIGALLFDLVCEDQNFDTRKFLRGRRRINKSLSYYCQDFLYKCLLYKPRRRATLVELQSHPWLHKV